MTAQFIILLVEDNPADVRLTKEALQNGKVFHDLYVVTDGLEALNFLYNKPPHVASPRPDLILLDLNLPGKDGWEVLSEIKKDPSLARIPVFILASSKAEEDIFRTYDLHANGYIVKPVDLEQFFNTIKGIKDFWMSVVKLPPKE